MSGPVDSPRHHRISSHHLSLPTLCSSLPLHERAGRRPEIDYTTSNGTASKEVTVHDELPSVSGPSWFTPTAHQLVHLLAAYKLANHRPKAADHAQAATALQATLPSTNLDR